MSRVLLVDDDHRLGVLLERLLKPEGFQLELATDGLQGAKRASTEVFDLIILDVMLPGLDGFEVLRRVRQQSDVPVIMLTAKGGLIATVSLALSSARTTTCPSPSIRVNCSRAFAL